MTNLKTLNLQGQELIQELSIKNLRPSKVGRIKVIVPSKDLSHAVLTIGKNQKCLVDFYDLAVILKFGKWGVKLGYATTGLLVDGKIKQIAMHRLILNARTGQMCDHINGDRLDNRRSNLRLVTYAENAMNRGKSGINRHSKFKGICFDKYSGWKATIRPNGKYIHLGYYQDEKQAAKVYDKAAKKYFGKYARLNFPSEMDNLKLARGMK